MFDKRPCTRQSLLAVTSTNLLFNLPVAIGLIVLAIWVATHFQIELAELQKKKRRGQARDSQENVRSSVPPTPFASLLDGLPGKAAKGAKSWREQVKSPVVESAWEILCGSILQEVAADQLSIVDSLEADMISSARPF